jgi:CheY-like chemotaxis protein
VLVVDDDTDLARDLARCLSAEGFSTMTCEDGDEAVAALEGMDFDHMIVDIQMPRYNGLSVLEWTRRNRPNVRAIAMTAFGSRMILESTRAKGAAMYLEKPVDPKLLVEVLRSDLGGGAHPGGRTELVQACVEAARTGGGGEVLARSSERIGRVFFSDGRVAWAVASTLPSSFTSTLERMTSLDREALRRALSQCRDGAESVIDRLVGEGLVGEEVMRDVLLHMIVECVGEIASWEGLQVMFVPFERSYAGSIAFGLDEVLPRVSGPARSPPAGGEGEQVDADGT